MEFHGEGKSQGTNEGNVCVRAQHTHKYRHTHPDTVKLWRRKGAWTLNFPYISLFFPTITGTSSHTLLCKHHLNGLNCHWHAYLHYHCTSTHMQTYILLIFLPSCCCVVRQAGRPTQKCQRGGELGKGGLINGAPLSTAMPLRKALWLHIALPPNEAQLLEENDSFALELQGIIA